ncbi:MAG TPA: DEAD/DEAH box helicase, partial [Burkholderiaceae bacterium]|nr:DEAD/DEAH box helicase [Burkholderiaceae bacterium]
MIGPRAVASRSSRAAAAPPDPQRLAKLGIRSPADLLLHLPLRYEDETRLTPIAQARAGTTCQVQGRIVRSDVIGRGRRSLVVEIDDGTGRLALRFLHFYPSQRAQLAIDRTVRALGEIRGGLFGSEMVHPRYRLVSNDAPLPQRLTPVYPVAAGIAQSALRATILAALAATDWAETVPAAIVARLKLPPLLAALRLLHEPPASASLDALEDRSHPAWRRVIFDELLAQQLSLKRARALRSGQTGVPLRDRSGVQRLRERLPFGLTGAQQRAFDAISADLARPVPMNRLLQGDVGSGRQAALMAPTEILAEQHYRKLAVWLEPLAIRFAWLSGSLKASEKKAVRGAVAAGDIDLVIGTHALIEESVDFPRLGLAIVDEQHRFGVAQRLA